MPLLLRWVKEPNVWLTMNVKFVISKATTAAITAKLEAITRTTATITMAIALQQ